MEEAIAGDGGVRAARSPRRAPAQGRGVEGGAARGEEEEERSARPRRRRPCTRRFASWREVTLICVLVRLVRKMGALFASSVGAYFFHLNHCGRHILRLRRVLPTLLETV